MRWRKERLIKIEGMIKVWGYEENRMQEMVQDYSNMFVDSLFVQ